MSLMTTRELLVILLEIRLIIYSLMSPKTRSAYTTRKLHGMAADVASTQRVSESKARTNIDGNAFDRESAVMHKTIDSANNSCLAQDKKRLFARYESEDPDNLSKTVPRVQNQRYVFQRWTRHG